MKVKITYEGDQHEDATDIKTLLQSGQVRSILYEYDQELRKIVKYAEDNQDPMFISGVDKARQIFWHFLTEGGIDLDG